MSDEIDKQSNAASSEPRAAGSSTSRVTGLYDRYLLALGLLIAVIIVFAFTGDGDLGPARSASPSKGSTLLVILRSSRVAPDALLVAAAILVGVSADRPPVWWRSCSTTPSASAVRCSWAPCSPSSGRP